MRLSTLVLSHTFSHTNLLNRRTNSWALSGLSVLIFFHKVSSMPCTTRNEINSGSRDSNCSCDRMGKSMRYFLLE
ncbi:MAG: hypothetical protein EB023_00910 [Flavobacteriia bacterium]|nr:hypothetical protein [Flavobacteriia bacterium]